MAFLEWMARYYHYPLGRLIFDVLPKEPKKIAVPDIILAQYRKADSLNSEQDNIYKNIKKKLAVGGFSKTLIHGVTGSGKNPHLQECH